MIAQWICWRLAQAGVTIKGSLDAMAAIVGELSDQHRARLRPEPLTWQDSGVAGSFCSGLRFMNLTVYRHHGVWCAVIDQKNGPRLHERAGFDSKEEAQRHAVAWALQTHDDETARCLASLVDLDAVVTR